MTLGRRSMSYRSDNDTIASKAEKLAESSLVDAEEKVLCQQLQIFCDENGKERNPQKSACIIHQLGRVYRKRTPDKISLIRSAILFNAALVRKPSNADEIESDLRELCSHVLRIADAQDKDADLIGKAKTMFEDVRDMREVVGKAVKSIKHIPEDVFEDQYLEQIEKHICCIKDIQELTYQCFVKVMGSIADCCVKVMGVSPCAYALCGMGSLVTKEITPYSDFESFIVLEDDIQHQPDYEHKLEYFRWVATIFQLILVSFGETVIYDAAIPSLNHPENKEENWFFDAFTPCGISPDGFYPHASHNPLGRQDFTKDKPWKTELIKPVSEMLKYLDEDEDRKNGFHLADILTKFCFVSGDRDLFHHFDSTVKSRISETGMSVNSLRLMKEDQQRFGMTKGLWSLQFHSQFDMKRVIYRTITMSVAALGQLHGKDWSSSFEVIDQLDKSFPKHLRIKFKHAVAIACEIRLKSYLAGQGQISTLKTGSYANSEYTSTLVELLGVREACDFIITAFCLQEIAVKVFEEKRQLISTQAPETKPEPKLLDIWLMSLKICTHDVPDLRKVIASSDATMRLMNYDFHRQVELFEHEKLMHHYSARAFILCSLEQMKESLECCEKALSLNVNAPLSVRMQMNMMLKVICNKYFPDDEVINDNLEKLGCKDFDNFLGVPVNDIYLDSWKRGVEEKQPIFDNDVNAKCISLDKTYLRQLTLMVILKLGSANLSALNGEPLSMMAFISNSANNVQGNSLLKNFSLPNILNGLYTLLENTGKTTDGDSDLSEEEQVEGENNADGDEFIALFNQAAPSMGLAKLTTDEQKDKLKNLRSSLSPIFRSTMRLATLAMTICLRQVKQIREGEDDETVSTSYPTQDEFQSLGADVLHSLKDVLSETISENDICEQQEDQNHSNEHSSKSDFVEDDLD